ncbi:cyclic nucleotide-gated ion channel 1 [Olea europaea subsp. europaea]|uniref:Cyclic nucleotide-gated ion channel 1 n=1 Tax=Olea europaea subsp. europaea TaxID=158383 RepID=A0A8S0U2N5_OLEEU|nr:cyclic nucleotide-gated ion channel 1 [Olea europaea subsp. europaea]
MLYFIADKFHKGFESGSERTKRFTEALKSLSLNSVSTATGNRGFSFGIVVSEFVISIARRVIQSLFCMELKSYDVGMNETCSLPFLSVVIWIIIPKLKGLRSLDTKNMLKFVVFFQYVPRVLCVYLLCKEVTRTSGILTQKRMGWSCLQSFSLHSFKSWWVLGAFWYLFSIECETTCWQNACGNQSACRHASLYCEENANKTVFDFGIFLDALQSRVVESTDFPQKFFYGFWWGLQNLSSLGQNLKMSTFVWEIYFVVFISISGLVLFSFFIGNMQTFLQSTTLRLEKMRVKRRDAEQWMSHRLLPESQRERIQSYEQYKWQETRGVDEENLVHNLPKDLRRDIKCHLCLALLMTVPMFEKMDEQLLDVMCNCLKPVRYTENSFIVLEGDLVDVMLFIMRGKLLIATTSGGRTGFLNSDYLKAGDFCGEELLTWALYPHSSSNLPISTRTIQAFFEVEAFALVADDLKFLASQFRRLHSKQLRHTFRFSSQWWRTGAACFIQAA